jgi:hypothetical protein
MFTVQIMIVSTVFAVLASQKDIVPEDYELTKNTHLHIMHQAKNNKGEFDAK